MKKYQIRRHGKVYKVLENSTNQYVGVSKDRNKAKKFMQRLEGGCGFDGTTPTFLFTGCRFGVDLDERRNVPVAY